MGSYVDGQDGAGPGARRASGPRGGGGRAPVRGRGQRGRLVLCVALVAWLVPVPGGLVPTAAAGTTRYVAPGGSDSGDCSVSATPCRTIGYALSQAQAGDTISVAAGTYAEHLDIEQSVTVAGAGASSTIIDGSNSGTVVSIGLSNTAAVVTLMGVRIQHGNAASNGGGILNGGTLSLTGTTVISNTAGGYGSVGGASTARVR